MFEKVNKAYEFLCTKSAKIVDGPDPENIILILKTQSILFNRHKEGKHVLFSFTLHLILPCYFLNIKIRILKYSTVYFNRFIIIIAKGS